MPFAARLLVFDLDGTLFDSLRDLADAANALIAEYGGAPLEEETIGRMVGEGGGVLVRRVLEATGLAAPPREALSRFLELYDGAMLSHTRPYPGIDTVLDHFAGRVPMAVLTNKTRAASLRLLDQFGFTPHFFEIVGSDGEFRRKPAPDGMQHLIERAGTRAEESVLIGDSLIDFDTAAAAGAHICLARYGFGYTGFPREPLTGRELFIDRPEELIAVVGT